MKVILVKDVKGLGRAGDIKEVSDGYARNFLLAQKLGLPATGSQLVRVEKERVEQVAKEKKERERLEILRRKLEQAEITLQGRADKTHLFAAIKPKEVAQALSLNLGFEVMPDQIIIDQPLKTLGEHRVQLRFAQTEPIGVKLMIEAAN